jgi:excisionase family DNA binding protein
MQYVIEPTDIDNVEEIAHQNGWVIVSDTHKTRKPLSITEAAKKCSVHVDTMRRWADSGKISSFRTPGGHRRIPESSLPSSR